MAVPLKWQGAPIGVLVCSPRRARTVHAQADWLFESSADQAVIAIECTTAGQLIEEAPCRNGERVLRMLRRGRMIANSATGFGRNIRSDLSGYQPHRA